MYCDNCHKQSPDNFKTCAYCGAVLEQPKKPAPSRFVKKERKRTALTVKMRVAAAIAVAAVIVVAAAVTASLTSSKPESVIKKMTAAVRKNDAEKYYSLYDDTFTAYKKDNAFYDDERTFEELTAPLKKSDEFYTSQCGEDYKLTYVIDGVDYFTAEELAEYCDYLSEYCGYTKLPKEAASVSFRLHAKGEKGEYESVYRNFYCHKLGSKWYKAEYNVESENGTVN